MARADLSHDALPDGLTALANRSLGLWPVPPDASARPINVSENATYVVENDTGYRSVLRVHREGYRTERAIECELLWMEALNADRCVTAPRAIPGRDGGAVQSAGPSGPVNRRFMVMFEFVEGEHPDESCDLAAPFEDLGEMAARAHDHAIAWTKPRPFERPAWDLDAVFGPSATWGDWRDGPNIDAPAKAVLERAEATVTKRLEAFGTPARRYGLIHADMRLANLLIDGGAPRLIDFDDCGFGWFLYDFATGVSFLEDSPDVPALRHAWTTGYRKVRPLPDEEEREIDSFVMLRRMALLAWIGSHIDVPEARARAADFGRVSAELGEAYLTRMG